MTVVGGGGGEFFGVGGGGGSDADSVSLVVAVQGGFIVSTAPSSSSLQNRLHSPEVGSIFVAPEAVAVGVWGSSGFEACLGLKHDFVALALSLCLISQFEASSEFV
ncbi:unnamed protein product [Ilex paraguariensis]|uniref:Uncharacterized protein n=1 Tax=Ilex paraguariensis TaxID=185542 RepID=A0ABC8QQ78_9AQUA